MWQLRRRLSPTVAASIRLEKIAPSSSSSRSVVLTHSRWRDAGFVDTGVGLHAMGLTQLKQPFILAAANGSFPPILTLGGHGRYAEFPAWRRAIKDANSDSSATAKPSEAISKSRRSSFAIPFFGQAARNRLAASENPTAQSP